MAHFGLFHDRNSGDVMPKNAFFAAFLAGILPFVVTVATPVGAQTPTKTPEYQVGDRLGGHSPQKTAPDSAFREISWDDLIPGHWEPERFLEALKLDELQDNDPRAAEVLAKIRSEWDNAPLNTDLKGQAVRLPGFVVLLEADSKGIHEFLLVPYFGACVHVPPPPLNQLIHVRPKEPISRELTMSPVWIEGHLDVKRIDTSMGNAGYQLKASRIWPYEAPPEEKQR
jgi:uncharacterized protein